MNYLYLGINDFYLPAAAAAVHLGLVPLPLDYGKLQKVKYFQPFNSSDEGKIFRLGTDKNQNDVFLAGVSKHPEVFIRGLASLFALCRSSQAETEIILCQPKNLHIGRVIHLLDRLGLHTAADKLGAQMVFNRLAIDLKDNSQ